MLYNVTYMQDLRKIIQILYTKQTHRERKLIDTKGERERGMVD